MCETNRHILDLISKLAHNAGFSAAGCIKAEKLDNNTIESYMYAQNNGFFGNMDYLSRNCDKRFDPRLLVNEAKSIVVFLAPFGENSMIESKKSMHPKVSQYARGEDYHKVIKDKLFMILKELQQIDASIKGRPFTDSAPVLERAWAQRAGLGFIGKNNFLISPENGIRNFIGELILNIELPYGSKYEPENNYNTKSIMPSCGNCTRCLDACPTGALYAPYSLNASKCTSYLTIEKNRHPNRTDILSDMQNIAEVNGWIFGCDECMDACPWNNRNRPSWPEFLHKNK